MKLLDTRIFECNNSRFEVISNLNNEIVAVCDTLEKAKDIQSKLYQSTNIVSENSDIYDLIERTAEYLTEQMSISDLEEFYFNHQCEHMDNMTKDELIEYTNDILGE